MSAYKELPYFSMEEFNAILKEKAQLDRRLGQLKAAIKNTMEAFTQGIVAGGSAGSLEQLLHEGATIPEQLRDLLHNAEIGAIVCDTQETIAAISHNLVAVLGYAHEELIGAYKGMLWVERPHSQETGQLLSAADYVYNIYKVKQKLFSAIHEDAYITRDGRVNPVLQHHVNLLSNQGAVIGALYLLFRKMVGYAEEELVNQPVTIVSPLTGTYQTVSGKPYSITEYDVQVMADTLAALFEKERSYAAFQYFKDRNGVLIPTEVNLSLLKNREGEVIGILRNIHNLTERERLQQKIKELSEFYRLDNIVGKSRSMQEIFRLLKKVAESESTVLIQGEKISTTASMYLP